jgi:hypothetical protein
MVKNLVGPPVLGSDFVGRQAELASAWDNLKQGNSLLLASPRRVGKSSFARKLIDIARAQAWQAIYLDLQGVHDENEFAALLAQAAKEVREKESRWARFSGTIQDLFGRVKKVEISGVGVELEKQLDRFYQQLEQRLTSDKPLLVVVDELAVFLQALSDLGGNKRVEMFLNWLRRLRQEQSGHIAWIFCSSISITSFVAQNKLSHTVNDLYSFNLGEMTTSEATSLLNMLCQGAKVKAFTDEEVILILERIGWKIPFFIQLFFKKFMEARAIRPEDTLSQLIDGIFEQVTSEQQLFTWSERLAGYGRYEAAARTLLNYLCLPEHQSERAYLESIVVHDSEGIGTPKEVYAEVKQMLDNDGYLVTNQAGDISFRSPIIRQYWFNKYMR